MFISAETEKAQNILVRSSLLNHWMHTHEDFEEMNRHSAVSQEWNSEVLAEEVNSTHSVSPLLVKYRIFKYDPVCFFCYQSLNLTILYKTHYWNVVFIVVDVWKLFTFHEQYVTMQCFLKCVDELLKEHIYVCVCVGVWGGWWSEVLFHKNWKGSSRLC